MARNDPQVNLRMPEALKIALDAAAQGNNRSLTAEIVARLQESFAPSLPSTFAISLARLEYELIEQERKTLVKSMQLKVAVETLKLIRALSRSAFDSATGGDAGQYVEKLLASEDQVDLDAVDTNALMLRLEGARKKLMDARNLVPMDVQTSEAMRAADPTGHASDGKGMSEK